MFTYNRNDCDSRCSHKTRSRRFSRQRSNLISSQPYLLPVPRVYVHVCTYYTRFSSVHGVFLHRTRRVYPIGYYYESEIDIRKISLVGT